MARDRDYYLNRSTTRIMQISEETGRIAAIIMTGTPSENAHIDQASILEHLTDTSGKLEVAVTMTALPAAYFGGSYKASIERSRLEAKLQRLGYEPLTEEEKQAISRESDYALNKGFLGENYDYGEPIFPLKDDIDASVHDGGDSINDDDDDPTVDPVTTPAPTPDPVDVTAPGVAWKDPSTGRTHVQDGPNHRGYGTQAPVLLDLDGDGIEVVFGADIYFDTDGDGSELKSLADWGISEIGLAYDDGTAFDDESNDVNVFGNTLHGLASYIRNGQCGRNIFTSRGVICEILDTQQ